MLKYKNIKLSAFLMASLSGMLSAIGYLSESTWFLCFIAYIPIYFLFLGTQRSQLRRCIGIACFSYAFFYYTISLSWLYSMKNLIPFEGNLPIIIITVGLVIIILQNGIAIYLMLLPFRFSKYSSAFDIIRFAFFYACAEWIQVYFGLIPFPWMRIGLAVMPHTSFIQSASLFGGLFITFLVLIVNGGLAYLLLIFDRKRKKSRIVLAPRDGLNLLVIITLLFANTCFGVYREKNIMKPNEEAVEVLLVQGNHSGVNPNMYSTSEMLTDYVRLTKEGVTNQTKLVIWPETSIPIALSVNSFYLGPIEKLCKDYSVEMIVGAYDREYIEDQRISYNAMYLINQNGIFGEPYYKQKLVPFGEYLPYASPIAKLSPDLSSDLKKLLSSTPGSETILMNQKEGKVGGIICYESIYPEIARNSVRKGAQVLALISNDSWFGESQTALYQHHCQARMRAVENGRYILRASTTGITSVISPLGEIVSRLEDSIDGYLREEVTYTDTMTIYTMKGDLIIIPALILWAFGISRGILTKRKSKVPVKNCSAS